jgi:predicted transcriptional regulator
MHTFVKVVSGVATRYAPSRVLSFGDVHVFKTLQLLKENKRVSRTLLCQQLGLGEGAIKTLVKHLKMSGLIVTTNGGTTMTAKGKAICEALTGAISAETTLPKCSVALGKYNHAVILKDLSYFIKSGIEQRDAAIKMDATGATTLLYIDKKFVMPTNINHDSVKKEPAIRKLLIERLRPEQHDVIIIGSSDDSPRAAEMGAKNAALFTLVSHETHVR